MAIVNNGYQSGSLSLGEMFVVVQYQVVSHSGIEYTWEGPGPVYVWDMYVAETSVNVLGPDDMYGNDYPDPKNYPDGTVFYKIIYNKSGMGWVTYGWLINSTHGSRLSGYALGGSDRWGEYEYRFQLRRSANLYDKDGTFLESLPTGTMVYIRDSSGVGSSKPHWLNIRHFQRPGESTIYQIPYSPDPTQDRYGWIDTRPDLGTWRTAFTIIHNLSE